MAEPPNSDTSMRDWMAARLGRPRRRPHILAGRFAHLRLIEAGDLSPSVLFNEPDEAYTSESEEDIKKKADEVRKTQKEQELVLSETRLAHARELMRKAAERKAREPPPRESFNIVTDKAPPLDLSNLTLASVSSASNFGSTPSNEGAASEGSKGGAVDSEEENGNILPPSDFIVEPPKVLDSSNVFENSADEHDLQIPEKAEDSKFADDDSDSEDSESDDDDSDSEENDVTILKIIRRSNPIKLKFDSVDDEETDDESPPVPNVTISTPGLNSRGTASSSHDEEMDTVPANASSSMLDDISDSSMHIVTSGSSRKSSQSSPLLARSPFPFPSMICESVVKSGVVSRRDHSMRIGGSNSSIFSRVSWDTSVVQNPRFSVAASTNPDVKVAGVANGGPESEGLVKLTANTTKLMDSRMSTTSPPAAESESEEEGAEDSESDEEDAKDLESDDDDADSEKDDVGIRDIVRRSNPIKLKFDSVDDEETGDESSSVSNGSVVAIPAPSLNNRAASSMSPSSRSTSDDEAMDTAPANASPRLADVGSDSPIHVVAARASKRTQPSAVLIKPRIVHPEKPPVVDGRPPLRRSSRLRVAPLRHWMGEHAIYVPDGNGNCELAGITDVTVNDPFLVKYRTSEPVEALDRCRAEKKRKSRASRMLQKVKDEQKRQFGRRSRKPNRHSDDVDDDDDTLKTVVEEGDSDSSNWKGRRPPRTK